MMPLLLALALLCYGGVNAQLEVVGTDICHCQPDEMSIRFSLSNSCLDSTVLVAPGIGNVVCSSEGTASVPTKIDTVEFFEQDGTSQVISTVRITGPFRDGDTVSYSTIASTSWSSFTSKNMPRGIRMVMTASDANGDQKVNEWTILFDGNCGGDQIGWSVFSTLGDPNNAVCPLSLPPPTAAAISPPSSASAPGSDAPSATTSSPTLAPASSSHCALSTAVSQLIGAITTLLLVVLQV